MDKQNFKIAIQKATSNTTKNGIGTLSEKTLHSVLKYYYQPYDGNHEVKIGSYFVDIICEDGVIEIQTGNFYKLKKKLILLLEVTNVTVVFPIAQIKWIYWIDNQSGEVTKKRKSPKSGTPFDILYELYWIKDIIVNDNLNFIITMLEIDEYRKLDGWSNDKKKGSTKVDKIPSDIISEIEIRTKNDYLYLLPNDLKKEFTAKELAEKTKTTIRKTQCSIQILKHIGVIKQVGKKGRAFLYSLCE